jgi:hypothetical protein
MHVINLLLVGINVIIVHIMCLFLEGIIVFRGNHGHQHTCMNTFC